MTSQVFAGARRGALGAALAVAAGILLALPAWAFFSIVSSGATGVSAAGTLGTPGATTSGVTASNVTFTITAPPTGPTPTAYRVARTAPSAAASVCTVTGSSGSCSDPAPVDGQTNTYAVYARLSGTSWESPTPQTVSVVVPSGDTTAPVTTATTSPTPNGAGWNTGSVTVTLNATDASGVAATYYTTDGSTPTTSSTVYTAPFAVTQTRTVRFFSVDTVGNAEAPKTHEVRIDPTAPTGAVTSPSGGATVGGTVTVSGTSSDTGGSGVASVQAQYKLTSDSTWTDLTTTGTGTWSSTWATGGLANGSYSLQAVVKDVAGNTTTTNTVAVTVTNAMTVTASTATPTAGTPFELTLQTTSAVTGPQAVTVTGLQTSPNGTAPTVPTTATFTNGTATISVTAVRAGSQTVTVALNAYNRQGSTTVTVAPKQGRLFFSSCSGHANYTCSTGLSNVTLSGASADLTFKVTRQSADDYGNPLSVAGPVTVSLALTNTSQSTLNKNSVGIAGGQTESEPATLRRTTGQGKRDGTITATAPGYSNAVLMLQ